MKIYFAGSIRGGRDDRELYAQLIALLQQYGEVLTEHIGDAALSAMGEGGVTDEYIHDRDVAWVRAADAVVAEVTSPSLGVGYEIGKAHEMGKRILCLYRPNDVRRLSAMIRGNSGLTHREYSSVDEAAAALAEFFGAE